MGAILDILVRARNQASGPLGEVTGSVQGLQKAAGNAVKGGLTPLTNALSTMAANYATQAINGLVSGVSSFVTGSIQAASYVEEMRGKFAVVFGDMAGQTEDELTAMATAMNRSKFEFMDFAALIQDTFVPMGFAREEAQKLSVGLVGLATDVASFNNFADADVMRDFQSALVGNHETVRKYGVLLNETTLKEELSRMGKEDLVGSALEQAKVQARLNIIMASTSDAHGDAERTAGSYANSMRGLSSIIQEFRASVGAEILPALAPFISMIGEFIREYGPKFVDWFADVMEGVANWKLTELVRNFLDALASDRWTLLGAIKHALYETFGEGAKPIVDAITFVGNLGRAIASLFGDVQLFEDDPPLLIFLVRLGTWIRETVTWLGGLVAKFVDWSDVLTVLGLIVATVVVGPLAGFLLTAGKVALAVGGWTLLVAGVRAVWETDFLGIRTFVEGIVGHLTTAWQTLKTAFELHGAAALREIWAFVTGNETSFENLGKVMEAFRLVFVTTLEAVVTKLGEWTVLIVDFVLRELPNWVAALGRFASAAWEWLTETAIPNTMTQLGEWWKALSGWVSENVPRWAARMDELAAGAVAWLRDKAIPGTAEQLKLWWGALSGFLTTTLPLWVGKLGEWASAAWTWIRDEAMPKTRYELGVWWESFKLWLDLNLPIWRENLGKWATAAWEWLTETAIPKTLEKLGEWWGVFSEWFGKNWPEWKKNLGDWARTAWEWLTETAIPKTLEQLGKWWGVFSEWFGKNWPEWKKNLGDWAAAAWEWLTETAIPNTKKQLIKWWEEFAVWWKKNWPEWKKNMSDWAASTWEWLRDDVVPAVRDQLKEIWKIWTAEDGWVTKSIDWLKETFPGATATAIVSFADFRTKFGELVKELTDLMDVQSTVTYNWGVYVDAVFGILIAKFGLFVNVLTSLFKTVAHLIQGEWQDAWDEMLTIGGHFVTAYTEVGKHAKTVFTGQWFDIGEEVTSEFSDGIRAGTPDAVRGAGGFMDKVTWEAERKLGVESPSKVFRDIGINVVKGFAEGVANWAAESTVLSNMRTLAERTLAEFKRVLGIRSPSTEMYSAGTMMLMGALLGVQDMTPALLDALTGLGVDMTTTLGGAMQDASGVLVGGFASMAQTATAMTSALVAQTTSGASSMRAEIDAMQREIDDWLAGRTGSGTGGGTGRGPDMSNAPAGWTPAQVASLEALGYKSGVLTASLSNPTPTVANALSDLSTWAREISKTMTMDQMIDFSGFGSSFSAEKRELYNLIHNMKIPYERWLPMAQAAYDQVHADLSTMKRDYSDPATQALLQAANAIIFWASQGGVNPNTGQVVIDLRGQEPGQISLDVARAVQVLQMLNG